MAPGPETPSDPHGPEWGFPSQILAQHSNHCTTLPLNVACSSLADLREVTKRFSKMGVFNYTTLTLADPKGLLYVGAREAIFALRTNNMELEEMVSCRLGWPVVLGGATQMH